MESEREVVDHSQGACFIDVYELETRLQRNFAFDYYRKKKNTKHLLLENEEVINKNKSPLRR